MDTRELRMKKNVLENEILKFLDAKVKQFTEETGENIVSININMVDVSTVSEKSEHIITGVSIGVVL